MRRDRQGSSVIADEDAVTALLVPPVDTVLLRDSLKIGDLPIQPIAPRGGEKRGRRVHGVLLPVKQPRLQGEG